MGLINPTPGIIDFDGFRDLQSLFDAAKQAGIWIVLRPGTLVIRNHAVTTLFMPGPYINAETTAGGLAHWLTAEISGALRTNATDFQASWQDYIRGIINITVPNQITNGGPVIGMCIDYSYLTHD